MSRIIHNSKSTKQLSKHKQNKNKANDEQQWVCATNIIDLYDNNGDYIQQNNKKLNTYNKQYYYNKQAITIDDKYEYDAPKYIDLTNDEHYNINNDIWFTQSHPLHETNIERIAEPLYIDSDNDDSDNDTLQHNNQLRQQLSSTPKRLLRLTPGKPRRVINNISHDSNHDSDIENQQDHSSKQQTIQQKRNKSLKNTNNVRQIKTHNVTQRSSKNNKDNMPTLDMDDIIDDEITQLLAQHNKTVNVNNNTDSHNNEAEHIADNNDNTIIDTIHQPKRQHTATIHKTQSVSHNRAASSSNILQTKQINHPTVSNKLQTTKSTSNTQSTLQLKPLSATNNTEPLTTHTTQPQPVQRIKANIVFTAATTNNKTNHNRTQSTTTQQSKATTTKSTIKVSRHLASIDGVEAFDDDDLAQLLAQHNQKKAADKFVHK